MKTIRRAALLATLGGVFLLASSARAEDANNSRELFREGARLWPQTCGTCHNARPGSERSPEQWDIVMMHMRDVANLPEHQQKAILAYLKAR